MPRDQIERLAASVGRVHLRAREGLGLGEAPEVCDMSGWRTVVDAFRELEDADYSAPALAHLALVRYATVAAVPADDPCLDVRTLPAWEATARHLARAVNEEVEEPALRDLEAWEAGWDDWARSRAAMNNGATG